MSLLRIGQGLKVISFNVQTGMAAVTSTFTKQLSGQLYTSGAC